MIEDNREKNFTTPICCKEKMQVKGTAFSQHRTLWVTFQCKECGKAIARGNDN